jgi:cycloeucalenol cycloisomerase
VPLEALFAPNPAKAAVERYWLMFTPVWGLGTGLVMVTGWAESWGDVACLLYGVLMALGASLPAFRPHPSERGLPRHRRVGVKLVASVVVLSFGLNALQTPFFFDVLHMHFGFDVTFTLDRNPAFLYLVTVAYFSTYAALCMMALRALLPRVGLLAWAIAPMAMAFLEAVLNANPFTRSLFCYDDMTLVLTFGTVVYGFTLMLALPVWMALDEAPGRPQGLGRAVVMMLAVVLADRAALDLIRATVAPHLTTVVEDAPGLRDYEGSCLVRPGGDPGGA